MILLGRPSFPVTPPRPKSPYPLPLLDFPARAARWVIFPVLSPGSKQRRSSPLSRDDRSCSATDSPAPSAALPAPWPPLRHRLPAAPSRLLSAAPGAPLSAPAPRPLRRPRSPSVRSHGIIVRPRRPGARRPASRSRQQPPKSRQAHQLPPRLLGRANPWRHHLSSPSSLLD